MLVNSEPWLNAASVGNQNQSCAASGESWTTGTGASRTGTGTARTGAGPTSRVQKDSVTSSRQLGLAFVSQVIVGFG